MKTKAIRIISLALVLALSLSVGASAAASGTAQPLSNAYVKTCSASASAQGGGAVKIKFSTTGTGSMTSIGASCIKIYTSGGTWKYTFWPSSYPSMLGSGKTYSSSVTYYGSSGTSYYAVVTCYAKNSSGSGTETCTTGTVTA